MQQSPAFSMKSVSGPFSWMMPFSRASQTQSSDAVRWYPVVSSMAVPDAVMYTPEALASASG